MNISYKNKKDHSMTEKPEAITEMIKIFHDLTNKNSNQKRPKFITTKLKIQVG